MRNRVFVLSDISDIYILLFSIGSRYKPIKDSNRDPFHNDFFLIQFISLSFEIDSVQNNSFTNFSSMASCMALKRSFEHDRDSSSSNPFESHTPSPSSKRQRRCFPMTVVSSPAPTTNETTTESPVFPDVQPVLTTGN